MLIAEEKTKRYPRKEKEKEIKVEDENKESVNKMAKRNVKIHLEFRRGQNRIKTDINHELWHPPRLLLSYIKKYYDLHQYQDCF